MTGTRAAPELRLSWDNTFWMYSSENSLYEAAERLPPQVSKIITTFTPASICGVQQGATARVFVSRTRWRSAGRSYSISFTLRQSSLACPSTM